MTEGRPEILDLWSGDGGEDAKRRPHILTEVKNRGTGSPHAPLQPAQGPVRDSGDLCRCPLGIAISEAHLKTLPIDEHDTHGSWNYTVRPQGCRSED
ncbi:hypothetical protein ACFYUN_39410, partial [Streptomyces sp. NPDC004250]